MNDERRRAAVRIQTAQLISYSQFDDAYTQQALGMGITLDISEGGIKIRCKRPFPVSAVLGLNLAVGDRIVRSQARVVHCMEESHGEYVVGLVFTDLSAADRAALRDFLGKGPI